MHCRATGIDDMTVLRDLRDGISIGIFTGSLENFGEPGDEWGSEATMKLSDLRLRPETSEKLRFQ